MDDAALAIRPAALPDGAVLEVLAHDAGLDFSTAREFTRTGGLVLLATAGSSVVGFVSAQLVLDEAEIFDLAVHPVCRRRGIARRLLGALVEQAEGSGAARVVLEVRRGNVPAISLYEGAGFVQVGERRRYYRDGEDALLLALTLTRSA